QLMAQMADRPGISFLRSTRAATPVLYGPDEKFPIGGLRVVRSSANDRATVVGAGITLHEALKAADQLQGEGISVRVIDLYSLKPIDGAGLDNALHETGGRLLTVEDHWAEGGLGAAVLEALAEREALPTRIVRLAVHDMPGSGNPAELLAAAGIDTAALVAGVKQLL